MNPNNVILGMVVGSLLLLLGRKLFWFFVAVLGFLWGLQIAPQVLHGQSQLMILAVALSLGLLGAVLAIFLQTMAVGFAGFWAGAHSVSVFWNLLNWQNDQHLWLFSLVGGVVGAILAL